MTDSTAPKAPLAVPFSSTAQYGHNVYQHEKRVRLRVDVRPLRLQIADTLVNQGVWLVDVPESLVPDIEAMVIDKARYAQAVALCNRHNERWVEQGNAATSSPHSPEAVYTQLFFEEPGALNECTVVERDLPAPLSVDDRRAAAMSHAVATGLRSQGGKRR